MLRNALCHTQRATGRDAAENTLFARQPPRHFFGVWLAYVFQTINILAAVDFRQVSFRPFADAGDLCTLFRLDANDLDGGILLLENREQPIKVPVVPILLTKWVNLPWVSRQISGAVPS